MLDPSTIDAVVFDIGGVFLIPHPDPLCEALSEVGIIVEPDDDAFHLAHHRGVHALSKLLMSPEEVADEGRPEVWSTYDSVYFPTVGVPEHQVQAATDVRTAMRGRGVMGIWEYPLTINIEASARIAAVRPIAVVSNNDGTADQQMIRHGVGQVGPGPLPQLVALVDSGVVGIAKPDPAIFTPAVEALNLPRHRILYVGDTVHADVVGATAAGLQVVQLDPHNLHADYDHARIPDLTVLADLLV